MAEVAVNTNLFPIGKGTAGASVEVSENQEGKIRGKSLDKIVE